jgi:hypothetical protein
MQHLKNAKAGTRIVLAAFGVKRLFRLASTRSVSFLP